MPIHRCHAILCNKPIAPSLFMCGNHWMMLPYLVRQTIYRTYRQGQEIDKQPSDEYITAAQQAIHLIHQYEGKSGNLCVICINSGHYGTRVTS